jgi:hypothetical protein
MAVICGMRARVPHIAGYMPVVALWHLYAATPEVEDGQLEISQGLLHMGYPGTCPRQSWQKVFG